MNIDNPMKNLQKISAYYKRHPQKYLDHAVDKKVSWLERLWMRIVYKLDV